MEREAALISQVQVSLSELSKEFLTRIINDHVSFIHLLFILGSIPSIQTLINSFHHDVQPIRKLSIHPEQITLLDGKAIKIYCGQGSFTEVRGQATRFTEMVSALNEHQS